MRMALVVLLAFGAGLGVGLAWRGVARQSRGAPERLLFRAARDLAATRPVCAHAPRYAVGWELLRSIRTLVR